MSFQKRVRQPEIPGVRPSLHNGQPLTSTGNPSLDHIIGGGQQLGTIFLLEEDKHFIHSRVLVKYFLAEGIVQKHVIHFSSLDAEPEPFLQQLPALVQQAEKPDSELQALNEEMRIAWRYNDLPRVNSEQSGASSSIGHSFDLSKQIDPEVLKAASVTCWSNEPPVPPSDRLPLKNAKLNSCLQSIFAATRAVPSGNVLRIVLASLGDPYWYTDGYVDELVRFLLLLKAAVRSTNAVCFVTMPVSLLALVDKGAPARLQRAADVVVALESFVGTTAELNPAFKDYHGLLHVRRIRAVRSLVPFSPPIRDLAFKLRRRRFVIEKLHLPPELQETEQREQDEIVPATSCASGKKHLLEF